MIDKISEHNQAFVANKSYIPYQTNKYPSKKLAILTCMDTRLTELLPAALGLRGGSVKMIKNAGGTISNPFETSVRSLLIAVLELGVEEIMVIGHTDCGVCGMESKTLIRHLTERGISPATISGIAYNGIDLHHWLTGFVQVEDAVRTSVDILQNHPFMPSDVSIYGFVIDTQTGKLNPVN